MDISTLITYIALLIAIYTLSPEYMKLKISLSNFWAKCLFFLTFLIIYLLWFTSIKIFFIDIWLIWYLSKYLYYDIWWNYYQFILISVHFFSLYLILNSGKLSLWNQQKFYSLFSNLYNNSNFPVMYSILEKNLDELFYKKYKLFWNDKILFKYDDKKNFLIKFYWDWDNNIIWNKKVNTFINKWISFLFFKILKLEYINKEYLTNIIELILTEKFITELAINNELLWLKIIKKFLKYNYNNYYWVSSTFDDLERFSEMFLIRNFGNKHSIIYHEIRRNVIYEWKEKNIDGDYFKLLLDNSENIKLEKIVDMLLIDILNNKKNIKLLNENYSSDISKNSEIVFKIWCFLRIFQFIDIKKLDIWNIFIFILRDLIMNFKINLLEDKNSFIKWYWYLINEFFDIFEEIIEKTEEKEWDILIYFIMINDILESDNLWPYFKEKIVESFYYYIFNKTTHQVLRFNQFKKFIDKNKWLKDHFSRKDEHQRITFIWKNNEIFNYIDQLS